VTGILAIHVLLPFALVAEVGDVLIAIMMFAIPVTQLNQIVLIQNPSFRAILSVEFVVTHGSQSLCALARSVIISCNLVCTINQKRQRFS
jgi:hypothetical protein